eukprot:m51a1_g3859 putative tcp1- isoform a (482) ;mRNA; f:405003-407464
MLAIDGDREAGEDVRTQNVMAAMAVANVVRSSFGPVGLDKMLVDDIGDVLVTNDGATIVQQLEVEHPAAKVLVELAGLQDREVGDGTTTVILLAAELLRRGNELVKHKIHPTSVISGYRMAVQEATKYIQERLAVKIESLPKDTLMNVAKTALSSKVLGNDDADFFAHMAVDALQRVKITDAKGNAKYPVKAVNILKAHGKSAKDSIVVAGYALNCTAASQAMPRAVQNAKIACVDFNLNRERLALGVQVLVQDPDKLEGIRQREADIARDHAQMLIKAGANVVLTTKVVTERIGDAECILFRGKGIAASSMLLRGANEFLLDEMERSIHDALCIVKRTLESSTVVVGGGASDGSLSVYLEAFARTLGTREQLAVREFAEALLVIPKTLAINAALDAMDLVARLRAYHFAAQTDKSKEKYGTYGLDLVGGAVRDNLEAGVLEPAVGKIKCLKFATEAAINILRIDEVIKLRPKKEARPQDD